jgi:hypothetical protein
MTGESLIITDVELEKSNNFNNIFVWNDQLNTNIVMQMREAEIDFKTI